MLSRSFYIKLIVAFILITGIVVFFYIIKLRSQIEANTFSIIEETAAHDRRAIHSYFDLFIEELKGIEKRLDIYGRDSIKNMEARLNVESSTTPYSTLFMVAEDGRIFTDGFKQYDPPIKYDSFKPDFRDELDFGAQSQLIMRFENGEMFNDIAEDSILCALKLENFIVQSIRMTALVGLLDAKFLREHLIIDGFIHNGEALGFSSLIDLKGNYIGGGSKDVFINNYANFFTRLAHSREATLTKRDIQNKMKEMETFSFYMDINGIEKLVYFLPFDERREGNLDWYFIMIVNNDYLENRQIMFALMSMTLLGLVICALIIIMLYGISTHNKLYMAHEAVKIRSNFLSNMSHEIRTPLNGIIGLNFLISRNIDQRGRMPEIKSWLHKSRVLADYLLALLSDILDMARMQSGKIDLNMEIFSISTMMTQIESMFSASAKSAGINFYIVEHIQWPYIVGDEVHTKQILANVIGNALKFTKSKGNIEFEVTQELLEKGKVLTTYICKDTGIGMSKAFLNKIFDPFMQEASTEITPSLKGTGLGMPISKQLTEAMGGTIEVESVLGEGSKVIIRIPAQVVEKISSSKTKDSEEKWPPQEKRKILLAEDAEFNVEFLTEILADEGFEVTVATNGQEAVNIFRNSLPNEFKIILMDMKMPVMDGCEAARLIRSSDRPDAATVLIYACTANAFREDMERAMESGMNDFLTKPLDMKVFIQKLKEQAVD